MARTQLKTKTKKATPRKPRQTETHAPVAENKTVYVVEKNIKITSFRGSYQPDRFPLGQMNVGDSFLIPPTDPLCKNPNSLHYAAKMYARMVPGFTLTTRMQLDKARRVWRIK